MEPNLPAPNRPAVSRALRPWLDAFEEATAGQSGVASRAQLRAAGFPLGFIGGWRDRGLLEEVARGVFALRGARVDHRGQLWAAVLSNGGDTAVAGPQAFDLLDLVPGPGRPIHVVTTGQRRPQPGIVVRRTLSLPPADVVEADHLRCTSTARSLFDHAPRLTDEKIDQILNRAVQLRLFNLDDFDRLARGRPRAPGLDRLLAAIGRLDETSDLNRQELERRLIRLIIDSGLPTPAVNSRIGPWEVDIHWVGTRGIIEADGDRFHSSPTQIARDIAKQQALEAMGFVIRRFDWIAINYRQTQTVAEAERFRRANLAPPFPGPPPA